MSLLSDLQNKDVSSLLERTKETIKQKNTKDQAVIIQHLEDLFAQEVNDNKLARLKDKIKGKHEEHLYIMHNELFKYVGNIHKIGFTINPIARLAMFNSSHIIDCKFVYTSPKLPQGEFFESLVFEILQDCRVKREFFNCPLDDIKNTIKYISANKNNPSALLNKYNDELIHLLYKNERAFLHEFLKCKRFKALIEAPLLKRKKDFAGIIQSNGLSSDQYKKVKNNKYQMKGVSNQNMIMKYEMVKNFGIKRLDNDLMYTFENSRFAVDNLLCFLDDHNYDHLLKDELSGENLLDNKIKEKIVVIKEIVNILGFETGTNKRAYYVEIMKNLQNVIDKCEEFYSNNKEQFTQYKGNAFFDNEEEPSLKKVLGSLNAKLLKEFGIRIVNGVIKRGGKKVKFYTLEYIENISDFLHIRKTQDPLLQIPEYVPDNSGRWDGLL